MLLLEKNSFLANSLMAFVVVAATSTSPSTATTTAALTPLPLPLPSLSLSQFQEWGNLAVDRSLAIGDFAEFNTLFQDAKIAIPGTFEISERLLFALDIDISNIVCSGISIGDVVVEHTRRQNAFDANFEELEIALQILQLDLTCELEYDYSYGFLGGDGNAKVTTDNNFIDTAITFSSTDFDVFAPTTSQLESCSAKIEIVDIDLSNDFLSEVLEIFERFLRDTIEREVQKVACDELATLGTGLIVDLLVLVDEALAPYKADLGRNITDPLYMEQSFEKPSDLDALDLLDEDEIGLPWFSQGLDELDKLLGSDMTDSQSPTGKDLGINVLLRNSILDVNGELVLDASDLPGDAILFQGHDRLTETTIALDRVKVIGLDSLTTFGVFDRIGQYTFQTDIVWESLILEFDVSLDIKPSTKEDSILNDSSSEGIKEQIRMQVELEEINVQAALFFVIDQEALGAMPIGPLLSTETILPCLLSVLHEVQLAGLDIQPTTINIPTMSGFISPGIDSLISDVFDALFEMYLGTVQSLLPNIFQTSVRNIINQELFGSLNVRALESDCPSTGKENGFIDFPDLFLSPSEAVFLGGSGEEPYGDIAHTLMSLLKDNMLTTKNDGSSDLNSILVAPLTERQSGIEGTIRFPGNVFGGDRRIRVGGLDLNVELRLHDIRIDNLDSIGAPLDVLVPLKAPKYSLNNTLTLGAGPEAVSIAASVILALEGSDIQMRNEVDMLVDLSNIFLSLAAMLQVDATRFFAFPLSDILNIDCWLATLPSPSLDNQGLRLGGTAPTAALVQLLFDISKGNFGVDCVECSSPKMPQWSTVLQNEKSQDAFMESFGSILSYLEDQLIDGRFLQMQIDRALDAAAKRCPHSPTYKANFEEAVFDPFTFEDTSEDSTSFLVLLGGVALGLCVCSTLLVIGIRCFVNRRTKRLLATLSPIKKHVLYLAQERERQKETKLNLETTSMFTSNDIPRWIRWFMPVVILANIVFFLSGHLSLGATVNIKVSLAGEEFLVNNFFEFSMAKSTLDIWNAGGQELAILILIFSGIWPYTKQLLTLGLWFMPPSRCSVTRRGSFLLWLDCLAKWSMIDIFVLIISIAAFRVSVKSPDLEWLPESFYQLDLLVVPLWGLYANMIAQLISQVTSHIIIHYHRKIIRMWEDDIMILDQKSIAYPHHEMEQSEISPLQKDKLYEHTFKRPHREDDDVVIVKPWVNSMLLVTAFTLVLFVVLGCILPSFSLKVLGIIGVVVESGQQFDDAIVHHNIFTVMKLLFDEAKLLGTAGTWIGMTTLALLLMFTVLVVPILQSVALLYQWFVLNTRQTRERLSTIIETMFAWQYAEVFLISVFVASWQLGPISEFMINSYCDSLDESFAYLVFLGLMKPEDAQCFSIESTIEKGSFLLATGAILLATLNTFVNKAVVQYFRDVDFSKAKEKQERLSLESLLPSLEESKIQRIPVLFSDRFRWCLMSLTMQEGASFHSADSSSDGVVSSESIDENDSKLAPKATCSMSDEEDENLYSKKEIS